MIDGIVIERDSVRRLNDGFAEHMGEGIFVVCQCDELGVTQTVVLTPADLAKMLEAGRC